MAKNLKRSISIAGHSTSISLEPEFWSVLTSEAAKEKKSLAALVSEIDQTRGDRNLSSAIRVWLLKQLQRPA
jgi:predicted DNA-binding ribbon-helix-helix protein